MIKTTRGNDIKECAEKIVSSREIRDVYFVACGGSLSSFYGTYYLLRNEALNFDAGIMTANEFVHATPKRVNRNAVVVTLSLSGTPETIEAAIKAKKCGAVTIGISADPDSRLLEECDYQWVEGSEKSDVADADGKFDTVTQSDALVLRFGFELLRLIDDYKDYRKAMEGFTMIDTVCKKAERRTRSLANRFAQEYKDEETIYTIASGPLMGKAYALSICMFMEMEWIHSFAIHSDEFFNGPFEITDRAMPFVIFMNAGKTRTFDERALRFLKRHSDKVTIIDIRELGVSYIHPDVEEYFASLVANVMYNYASALAQMKCHPIPERKYMHKFDY